MSRKKRPDDWWRETELMAHVSESFSFAPAIRAQIRSQFRAILDDARIGTDLQRESFSEMVPYAVASAFRLVHFQPRTRPELLRVFKRVHDSASGLVEALRHLKKEEGAHLFDIAQRSASGFKIGENVDEGLATDLREFLEYLEFGADDLTFHRVLLLVLLFKGSARHISEQLDGTKTDGGRPFAFLSQRLFQDWIEVGLEKPRRKRGRDVDEQPFQRVLKLAFSMLPETDKRQSAKIAFAGAPGRGDLDGKVDSALKDLLKQFPD
jgi:hypothetical protein